MRRLVISLFCLMLFSTVRSASVPAPDLVTDVQLSAIAWDAPLTGVIVKSSGHSLEWQVPAFNRSTPIDYTGNRHLSFFRKDAGGEKTGLRPFAEVDLPADSKKILLLFFPSEKGRFFVYPVPDDEQDYTAGRARLMNVTRLSLTVKAGGMFFTLAPGESRLVAGDGRKLGVRLAVEKNGSWRQVSSSVLPLTASQRRSVFITTSDAGFFHKVGLDGEIRSTDPVEIFSVED